MDKETYQDYVCEIEELRSIFNLPAIQVLTLQIAAAFEIDHLSYDALVEKFLEDAKKITNSNNP